MIFDTDLLKSRHCEGPATSTPTPTGESEGESEEGNDDDGAAAGLLIPLVGAMAAAIVAF
jgi:hypothetical protein